jgi:hypothetical protein
MPSTEVIFPKFRIAEWQYYYIFSKKIKRLAFLQLCTCLLAVALCKELELL